MPLRKIEREPDHKPGLEKPQPFPPSPFQLEVAQRMTEGGTTLLTAPTGSGKTEAAFIPALKYFLKSQNREDSPSRSTGLRILLVCPLKALVDDLGMRLKRIIAQNWPAQLSLPEVSQITGDTPSWKRQSFRRNPTPILVTTPESLARLLAHPDRKFFLQTTETVIVDEWHSMAPSKRGADLSLSLARLSVLCIVPPKRIGLSATVANPQFLARQLGESNKSIQILSSRERKKSFIEIRSIPIASFGERSARGLIGTAKFIENMCPAQPRMRDPLLVFVQTRSLAERLAYQLSRGEQKLDVVLHHGSLSESMRRNALSTILFKSPDIIISTASLELGMDIGSVRTVILLDPPGEIVRMVQRIGRSGRGPNQNPKGILLIRNTSDLLEAGLSAALGMEHWLEPTESVFPHPPLDLLCQHLMGEATAGSFTKSDAMKWVALSPYFRKSVDLSVDSALDFLVGGNPNHTGRIPCRLKMVDKNYLVSSPRISRMVRQSIGTILVDPLIPVHLETAPESGREESLRNKHQGPGPCIGHIDEGYADSLKPGDRFLLAGKTWERVGGDYRHIVAREHEGTPRHLIWRGNTAPKSLHLCQQIYSFRALAKEKLMNGAKDLGKWLQKEMPLSLDDAFRIADWLEQQERTSEIPDDSSVLVESISTNCGQSRDYDIHLPLPAGISAHLGQLFLSRLKNNFPNQPLTGLSTVGSHLGLRILDSENILMEICNHLSQSPVQLLQNLFLQANWENDLRVALWGSDLHRRKFQDSAHLSLMVPPSSGNPRQRTLVGGRNWPARRLFDRVLAMNPLLLPMLQATNELISRQELQALGTWFEGKSKIIWKSRDLSSPSPFSRTWKAPSSASIADNPTEEDLCLASLLEALGDA